MLDARALMAAAVLMVLGASAAEGNAEIQASGVTLVAAKDVRCPPIVVPFGYVSPYATPRHAGVHDGIDISLPEGTPVLAIAAGKVISIGTNATFTGDYAWLQHAPSDTGLPLWLYSTYLHFDRVPDLEAGSAVKVAQVIGRSGKRSYPNLHLGTLVSGGDRYETRRTSVLVPGGRVVDPAVVYVAGLGGLADLELLPRALPSVLIPYATDDGVIRPDKSRVVWPVACKRL